MDEEQQDKLEALEGEEAALEQKQEELAEKTAEAEIKQLKDQLLRALAEAENTRRRAQKEIEDSHKYAVGNFAKELLVVADNFRRALEASPKEGLRDESAKSLVTGVEATERQLLAVLEKFGIKKIEPPIGQPFDPHFHRVMMEQENTGHPAGAITLVLQTGYMIHDRLLREAMVAVAKGAPAEHKVDTEA